MVEYHLWSHLPALGYKKTQMTNYQTNSTGRQDRNIKN